MKKKYIFLAEVAFDWSAGEYHNEFVEDIYVGCGEFEDYEEAKAQANKNLVTYCNANDGILYDSSVRVVPVC